MKLTEEEVNLLDDIINAIKKDEHTILNGDIYVTPHMYFDEKTWPILRNLHNKVREKLK